MKPQVKRPGVEKMPTGRGNTTATTRALRLAVLVSFTRINISI